MGGPVSRIRVITASFCGVAVLGLSAAPALAAGVDDPSPAPYPAASTTISPSPTPSASSSTSVGQTVAGENQTAPKVQVKAKDLTRDAPTQPAGSLAFTGSDAIIGGLVLGSGLLVVGGGLVLGGRRKRTAP